MFGFILMLVFLSGYSWVTFCIRNNFPAFMNVKDPQGLNVLARLNYFHC